MTKTKKSAAFRAGSRYRGPGFEDDACDVAVRDIGWLARRLAEDEKLSAAKAREFAAGVRDRIRRVKKQKWCRR